MTDYVIRGNVTMVDEGDISLLDEKLEEWESTTTTRITSDQYHEDGYDVFYFEIRVTTEEYKKELFDQLKPFVVNAYDSIDWHECRHNNTPPIPCVIAETYRGLSTI